MYYASHRGESTKEPNDPEYEHLQSELNKALPFKPGYSVAFNYIWPVGLRTRKKPFLQPMWLKIKPARPVKIGSGDVHLNWFRHDPWASLPVVKILCASIVTGNLTLMNSEEKYYTEIDLEEYLPYSFFGRDEPTLKS
ncbi:hypothetical protein [Brenneria rubrifaciens]|uniref:Uncharacterized protein n=1 Tax=Brenneria rubrifaciens TaxID=55213 RepID=A0A4P8QT99_9GAMM|nr:hypothetical protein [Brenneria rubrifaciens]QCR09836.1 hypothetical protein EH207_15725 [Brenneria rubrifaciens]